MDDSVWEFYPARPRRARGRSRPSHGHGTGDLLGRGRGRSFRRKVDQPADTFRRRRHQRRHHRPPQRRQVLAHEQAASWPPTAPSSPTWPAPRATPSTPMSSHATASATRIVDTAGHPPARAPIVRGRRVLLGCVRRHARHRPRRRGAARRRRLRWASPSRTRRVAGFAAERGCAIVVAAQQVGPASSGLSRKRRGPAWRRIDRPSRRS